MSTSTQFSPSTGRWHFLAAAVGVAAMYYAGATLGLALTYAPLPISVLWPPNALLMAALVLSPRRWWGGLIAAAFPAHLLVQVQGGVPAAMVLAWFVSNVSEAMIGALVFSRLAGAGPALRSARSVIAFFVAVVAAAFFSSFLDAAFVAVLGWGEASYGTLWRVRFFSNVLASVIFVPALLTCVQAPAGAFPRLARARLPEAAVLGAGLLTASLGAFNLGAPEPVTTSLLYLPLPFLVWAALRFGPSLTSTAFAGVAVLVIVGATHGKGPFVPNALDPSALPIQLFLLTMGAPLLLLAGLIEDQRETERRLRSSREMFTVAFRSGPDALAISRRSDGHVIEANEEWLRLMGHDDPGLLGPLASHLDDGSWRKLQQLAASGRLPRNVEVTLRDRQGKKRIALLSAAPVEVGGVPCEINMVRDITVQREAETEAGEQRKQLTHLTRVASLTDFSGTLAHELNQPLAAILSNAQAALRMLAQDPPKVDEVRSILKDVAEADKRAGVLIHHLRLLMKNSDEEFVQLDVNQLVQEVLDLVQGEFLARKVQLKTSFFHGLPHVHGDRVQLEQVILNLVLNACEAMELGGGPDRVLSITTHHDADGTVQVLVGDSGPGIAPQLLSRVFDPLYTTKANGLGLGLSICRKIAASHGAFLSVHSRPGEGATFRFALPATRESGQRLH